MAASKFKNRRRFISRDVNLDIPEDQELNISAPDDHNDLLPYPSPLWPSEDRTWPRKTWRSASDFYQSGGVGPSGAGHRVASSTLPRLDRCFDATSRFGNSLSGSDPGGGSRGFRNNSIGDSSAGSDTRWSLRSLSDAVSSTYLSSGSSPSEAYSEPCLKSEWHGSISHHDRSPSSPRNRFAASSGSHHSSMTMCSIPELKEVASGPQSVSGPEVKRRSYSLNESSAYRPFWPTRTARQVSPLPGSVLHRARNWEMAGGKDQSYRVVVSPIGKPLNPAGTDEPKPTVSSLRSRSPVVDSVFRRDAVTGPKHLVGVFDPLTYRTARSPELEISWKNGLKSVADGKNSRTLLRMSKDADSKMHGESKTSFRQTQKQINANNNSSTNTDWLFSAIAKTNGKGNFDLDRPDIEDIDDILLTNCELLVADSVPTANITKNSLNRQEKCFRQDKYPSFASLTNKTPPDDAIMPGKASSGPSIGRKPFRSKSLKLLRVYDSTADYDIAAKASRTCDWMTFSTPNSPPSPPGDNRVGVNRIEKHTLAKPCLSLVALSGTTSESLAPRKFYSRHGSITETHDLGSITLEGAEKNSDKSARQSLFNGEVANGYASVQERVRRAMLGTEEAQNRIGGDADSKFVVRKLVGVARGNVCTVQSTAATRSLLTTGLKASDFASEVEYTENNIEEHAPNVSATNANCTKAGGRGTDLENAGSGFEASEEAENRKSSDRVLKPPANPTGKQTPREEVPPCAKFTSFKDLSLNGLNAEERSTGTEARIAGEENEDGASARGVNGSTVPSWSCSKPTTAEQPSRLIRVFLKSSSKLKEEARATVGCALVGGEATGNGTTFESLDFVKKPSNAEGPGDIQENRSITVTNEIVFPNHTSGEQPVLLVAEFTKKGNQWSYSGENIREASFTTYDDLTPLQSSGEQLHRKPDKTSQESGSNDLNMDPHLNKDPRTARVSATKCYVEIKNSADPVNRKPFEIVKKKLIIPESMPLFDVKSTRGSVRSSLVLPASSFTVSPPPQQPQTIFRSEFGCLDRFAADIKNAIKIDAKTLSKFEIPDEAVEARKNTSPPAEKPNRFLLGEASMSRGREPNDFETTGFDVPQGLGSANNSHTTSLSALLYPSAGNTPITVVTDRNLHGTAGSRCTGGSISYPGDDFDLIDRCTGVSSPRVVDSIMSTDRCFEGATRNEGFSCQPVESEVWHRIKSDSCVPISGAVVVEPATEEDQFQNNFECSIMTELDKAIEMLTHSARPSAVLPCPSHASASGSAGLQISSAPVKGLPTAAVAPALDNPQIVSPAKERLEEIHLLKFFEGTRSPEAPTRVTRVTPKTAEPERMFSEPERKVDQRDLICGIKDKRNQWMLKAREDSFNRPESPLFRKPLALPKDSVIMRHRMHQKELGAGSGCYKIISSSNSNSSSESDEHDSPVPRVAPRRSKRSKNASASTRIDGMTNGRRTAEVERSEERDSIISSTTSIRHLSLDSSVQSD